MLAAVRARLEAGAGFALATLNLDHLVKLRHDPAFAEAYQAHDFVTADGNPVVALCRRAGQDVSLVTGADAVVPLCRLAAEMGVKVAFLGSTDAALDRAETALEAQIPGLDVAVKIAPPMGFDPNTAQAEEILAQISAAGVGLCFLALGAPKQECLAAFGRKQAPDVGFVSVGAALDFLAGQQRRAPGWMRAAKLEWLWRMLGNPRRLFGRYARSALILPGLWRAAGRQRR